MGPLVGALGLAAAMKKIITPQQESASSTPAQPAAPPGPGADQQDTGAESPMDILRKRAKGKKSLTIPTDSTAAGGTGLNI